jgi:hypothetical protein
MAGGFESDLGPWGKEGMTQALGKMKVIAATVGMALAFSGTANAAAVDDARARGIAWLLLNQKGDGSWRGAPGLDVAATATAVDALANAGLRNYSFAAATDWLSSAPTSSLDSLARQAASLSAAGANAAPWLNRLVAARNANLAWGAYDQFQLTVQDTALALNAIYSASFPYADLGAGMCQVLPSQKSDGTWSYNVSDPAGPAVAASGAILPTAYAVLTINTVMTNTGGAGFNCTVNGVTSAYYYSTAITNGLNGLLAKKKADGGFSDGTASTVADTALAYLALRILRPADAAAAPALAYLLNAQTTTAGSALGSWGNNALLTALAMKSLPPPASPLADTDGDGIPDLVEPYTGTNPAVADSRFLARGNGQGTSGQTAAQSLPDATLNQAYSATLPASGGVAPYAWTVLSGSPPPGLAVASATGAVSGTPATVGTFNFSYTTDSSPAPATVTLAQIRVLTAGGLMPMAATRLASASTLAPSANAKTAPAASTVELFIAGAPSEQAVIASIAGDLFDPGTVDRFYDDGGKAGEWAGHDYTAYRGVVRGSGTELDGQRVTIHYRAKGGAIYGVNPVALALPIERMAIDGNCIDTDGNRHWSCPASQTVLAIPDMGLSEVEPKLFKGVNLPAGAELPAELRRPLAAGESQRLALARPHAMVFGIAVNNRLPIANLAKTEVASILSGAERAANAAGGHAPTPLVLCRLANGSGVQAAANAYFLDNPCGSGGLAAATTNGNLANGPVVENASPNAVRNCLNESFANGLGAVGLLALADSPKPEDHWHFVALGGVSADVEQAAAGRYPWVAEVAYLWRAVDVAGLPKPAGSQKALIDGIAQRAAEPGRLDALPGLVALPASRNPVTGAGGNGKTCPASPPAPSAQ